MELMTSLVKAKYDQNPCVVKELLATGNKEIAESGRDGFYATGLLITHTVIVPLI